MAGIKTVNSPVRKKQVMLLSGLGVVVVLVAVIAAMLGAPKERPAVQPKESQIRKQFGAQEAGLNEKEVWRTQEGARVTQLQDELKDIKEKLKQNDDGRKFEEGKRNETERQRTEIEARRAAEAQSPAAAQAPRAPLQAPPAGALPGQTPGATLSGSVQPPAPRMPGQSATPGMPGGIVIGADGQPIEQVRGIVKIQISSDSNQGAAAAPAGKSAPVSDSGRSMDRNADRGGSDRGGVRKTSDNFLPTGTFIRATNLAGIDAPTGGQAQQNPHPIVFRVIDYANLPNRFRADYKDCFVTGNSYADLSSERAYIRLDRMSCIAEDGAAIDVSVKGYVAGEDGKAGMRGRLVSKQGAILANALVAGVASGIGSAFATSNTTVSTSALGTTTSVDPSKAAGVGISQGVGKALDKLASYYISLAEKMFPIVEIDSGREVDIVITRGFSIER